MTGHTLRTSLALAGALVAAGATLAEEGGSGHYQPGSMASLIDGVPSTETFLMRMNMLDHNASAAHDMPLPIGSLAAAGQRVRDVGCDLHAQVRGSRAHGIAPVLREHERRLKEDTLFFKQIFKFF